MPTIKIPISVDGATFDAVDVEEQRIDGTRATEISFVGSAPFALGFDGSPERVERDQAVVTVYPFTFSLWVRANAVSTAGVLFFVGDKDSNDDHYYHMIMQGDGRVGISSRDTILRIDNSIGTYDDNVWHLLIGVFASATDRRLYVDGDTLVASGTGSTPFVTEIDRYSIGVLGGSTRLAYFIGDIDDVAVWDNQALDATARNALYDSGSGVRANTIESADIALYLDLDDGTGVTATDLSGNGWHGALANMEEDDWIAGKILNLPTDEVITLADLDSGVDGSTWDMSTFDPFVNPNSESGTVRFQFAFGDSANPTNFNGSWLTESQMTLESDPSGRFLRIKTNFTGDGTQDATLGDGLIRVSIIVVIVMAQYPIDLEVSEGSVQVEVAIDG